MHFRPILPDGIFWQFWGRRSGNGRMGWISINANAETPFLPPFPSLPYLVFAGSRDWGSDSLCGMCYTRGLDGF